MNTKFREFLKNKKVLVTGGTGSIGSALVRSLVEHEPLEVRILSRDPLKQVALQNTLPHSSILRPVVGDMRDQERLASACEDIDIVFHAAAFKYVPQGESNPFEVIQTNIVGTQNLLSAVSKSPTISHFLMISTDKAVQPASVMGASKLLAERLVRSTHSGRGSKQKIFSVVRFGNVLGSSGSVLPLFREQMKRGEILVTHPEMTRFFMTIQDAVDLVFQATLLARGGDLFVHKMPVVSIKELAEACIKKYADRPVEIRSVGVRPGEKLHEFLITPEEALTTLETDNLFIILGASGEYNQALQEHWYPSAVPLKTEGYSTKLGRRLSPQEILELLERVESQTPYV